MKEYTNKEKHFDIACCIILPLIAFSFFIMAKLGFSEANYGTTYVAATQIAIMVLVIIPSLFRVKGWARIPYWLVFMIDGCLFMHAISLYAGFYQNFYYWSVIAHTVAGIVVTTITFTVLSIVQTYTRATNLGVYPLLFMSFMLLMGVGGLWELMEWGVDRIVGLNWMSYSIFDTTDDLVSDIVGSLIAIVCMLYIVRTKKMEDVVESINLGGIMRRIGAKADVKCGYDVYVPEYGEMTDIEFGKWEIRKKQNKENKE